MYGDRLNNSKQFSSFIRAKLNIEGTYTIDRKSTSKGFHEQSDEDIHSHLTNLGRQERDLEVLEREEKDLKTSLSYKSVNF